MKLRRDLSSAGERELNQAEAMVDGARDPEQFIAFAAQLWPRFTVFRRQTYWWCVTDGDPRGQGFYVEMQNSKG